METVLTNAHVVTADEDFDGTVTIKDGVISDIEKGRSQFAGAEDLDGDYLIPGLIDLHTDALEKQMMPRPNVSWNPIAATIAHDALTTTSAITTVYESLAAGASVAHPERNETLKPMIDSLQETQEKNLLRGEHFVHLRCEVTNPMVMELFHDVIDHPSIRFLSVNDHAPGHRQYPDMDYYRKKHMKNYGLNDKEMDDFVAMVQEQSQKFGPERRAELVATAHSKKIPAASHDDRTPEEVDQAVEEGMVVAEFPITFEAAELARERGLKVLAGGPNLCRGGSHHPGNLLTGDIAKRGSLDILVSDYVPISLVQGLFKLAGDEFGYSMPDAIAIGSKNPADAAGLTDRGEIAPGKRADLAQVKNVDGIPAVRRVWVKGERVA
ncbi:MAG TPA: phosphonate metabolism protein PhnM [Rhodospirillaceae bacterium]|nr:phosphonate metabolism protein PhnM [Rhodospirillaceae bacterium]HAT34818.1 phosphonate metabolism protein PhnM [Rhodospirillaceae bacterium]